MAAVAARAAGWRIERHLDAETFETVYGPGVADEDRRTRIEGGEKLAGVHQQIAERFASLADIDVSVGHVRFLSDDEAEVSFVLLLPSAAPMAPMGGRVPTVGYAVLVGHQWKVARETYCGLLSRVGIQCPPWIERQS